MTMTVTTATAPTTMTGSERDELMAGYLRRLGTDRAAPSVEALTALHQAHVERVPYETFWLHLGETCGITATESLRRIVVDRRGGYCFHLNGAFADLLDWLGYTVTRHVAGVHDATGPSSSTLGNHVALTVHGLPDDANPDGRWYVDAGLGDALHAPLPCDRASIRRDRRRSRSAVATVSVTGRSATTARVRSPGSASSPHRSTSTGSRLGHEFNATSPESSFARTVTAQRRRADGFDLVRGCVLTSRGISMSTQTIERRRDWLDALGDLFGIRLTVPDGAIDALWTRVRDAHDVWVAAADRGEPGVAA